MAQLVRVAQLAGPGFTDTSTVAAAGYVQSEDAVANPERTRTKTLYHPTEWETPPIGGHTAQPGDRKVIGEEEEQYRVFPFFRDIHQSPAERYWMAIGFHTIGCIIGVVGLHSLVRETWDHAHIRYLCYAFGGSAGVSVVLIVLLRWLLNRRVPWIALILLSLGFLSLFWSDWVLAFIKQDVKGVPDGNNAVIGWFYFVAKRLTMLSA